MTLTIGEGCSGTSRRVEISRHGLIYVGELAQEPPAGAPDLEDHVAFPWAATDAWFEEDDEIVGDAIDPHHRGELQQRSQSPWGRPGWWRDAGVVR